MAGGFSSLPGMRLDEESPSRLRNVAGRITTSADVSNGGGSAPRVLKMRAGVRAGSSRGSLFMLSTLIGVRMKELRKIL